MTTMTTLDDSELTVSDAMAYCCYDAWMHQPDQLAVEEDAITAGPVRKLFRELESQSQPNTPSRSFKNHSTHLPHNSDAYQPIAGNIGLDTTTTSNSGKDGHNFSDADLDLSFLDTLDEQLHHHPTQSFATICWEEAVEENVATQNRLSSLSGTSSHDSSDTVIFRGGDIVTPTEASPVDSKEKFTFYSIEELPYVDEKKPAFDPTPVFVNENTSHRFFDECFTGYDPKDAVHFYPISPLAHQIRARADPRLRPRRFGRITAFCATLPQRLLHSTSATC